MNLHTVSLTLADLRDELLAQPGRLNEKGYSGMTPLMFACWGNNPEKAQFLLSLGAGVNIRNNAEATAIHYACRAGNLDMISLLIEHGADINAIDRTGLSPLKEARLKGKTDVANLLMKYGAGLSLKIPIGRTAMTFMTKESEKQMIQGDIPELSSDGCFVRAQ